MSREDQAPPSLTHLRILRRVASVVNQSLDLDRVVGESLGALTLVTGHEMASLHLVSGDGRELLLRGERGLSERLRQVNRVLPVGEGLIGRVAASGILLREDDVARSKDLLSDARAIVEADGIRGFVCVPIHARDVVVGTLSLGRRTPDPFSDEEITLLECTADQIGLALDNARLYSETRHQLEQLRSAQTALVRAERLSAVGELAHGVAHEINNPLGIILAQVYLLLAGDPDRETRLALQTVETAARRAADIVRDLMHFARPAMPQRLPCNLPEQVTRALAIAAPALEAADIRVRTDFQAVPPVSADPSHIEEVLLQLIRNARQAMATKGGGTLTVRITNAPGAVRTEVEDSGPGIAADDLSRIFNPFFTRRGPNEGRGLGLSLAHSTIATHGGRLWAESPVGGGALFVFELPTCG